MCPICHRLVSSAANADLPVRNLSDEISKVDCSVEKVKAQHATPTGQASSPYKEIVGQCNYLNYII